jgi:ribulose kinase
MQDDALISNISVKSGMLLGSRAKKKFAVKLVIDVTVKVLRVMKQNQILLGG